RRHTRFKCDWSSDVCSSDLGGCAEFGAAGLSLPRGTSRDTNGIDCGLAIAIFLTGSMAMPPHSNMPKSPGNTSVPCSDGGVNGRSEERRVGKEGRGERWA